MSERPHAPVEDISSPDSFLYSKPFAVGSTVAGGLAGTAYGAAVANYLIPKQIDYVEGVTAHSSVTLNPGAVIDGRVTQFVAPNAVADSPVPGIEGVHTTVDRLQLDFSDEKLVGEYINTVSNFDDAVKATGEAIVNHLMAGAGIGAALGAGAVYGSIWGARRVKQSRAEAQRDIERLRLDSTDSDNLKSANRQEKQLARDRFWRTIRVGAVIGAVALVGGLTARKAVEIESPVKGNGEALSTIVSDTIPALKGAKIYGSGAQINIGILKIDSLKKDADKTWKTGYANLVPALREYNQTVGNAFSSNPDIRTLTHATDLHCNQANYEHFLGPAMKLINTDLAAVTGDIQTNSGTMFFEKNCIPGMIEIFEEAGKANGKTVPIVSVDGNHDDKTPRKAGPNYFDLTRFNMVKEFKHDDSENTLGANLTFVGTQDPRSTVKFPTTPVKLEDQYKGLAKQGEDVAGRACSEQNAGKNVIVMTHGVQAGFAAATRGCAALILNGHSHDEEPVKAILGENGRVVLQHTGGSASGAHEGFSIYEAPQQDASITNFYYSVSQHQFVGYYTVTLGTNGRVKINHGEMPSKVENTQVAESMEAFQDKYSAKIISPGKSGQDAAAKDKIAVIKNR